MIGQEIDLDSFLLKADQATAEYKKIFTNLVAEELRTYDYYRRDETLEETRRIKSVFIVYQSPKNKLVAEYRNVVEFNGKNVERKDDDIVHFFEKLEKADSAKEEYSRLIKEGNRYDGRSHVYGMTLAQAFMLNKFYRDFFAFTIAGPEKIEGRDVIVVDFKQSKQTARIRVNATEEELKQEPAGINFDTELASVFRPTNPRIEGKLWLDAETAQLWRAEYAVSIWPAALTKPVVSSTFVYEYQSSEFGTHLPRSLRIVAYRFNGKSEKDLVRTKSYAKTIEYSKFSKPDSEIKDTRVGNPPK